MLQLETHWHKKKRRKKICCAENNHVENKNLSEVDSIKTVLNFKLCKNAKLLNSRCFSQEEQNSMWGAAQLFLFIAPGLLLLSLGANIKYPHLVAASCYLPCTSAAKGHPPSCSKLYSLVELRKHTVIRDLIILFLFG